MLIKFGARFDTSSREYPGVACRDLQMLGALEKLGVPGVTDRRDRRFWRKYPEMQPGWIVGYGDMPPAPLAVKASFQIKEV